MELHTYDDFELTYKGHLDLNEVEMIELELGSLYLFRELGQSFIIEPQQDISDERYIRFVVFALTGPKRGSQFMIELERNVDYNWFGKFRIYELPSGDVYCKTDCTTTMARLMNYLDFRDAYDE